MDRVRDGTVAGDGLVDEFFGFLAALGFRQVPRRVVAGVDVDDDVQVVVDTRDRAVQLGGGSDRGAVPASLPVRFPGPPSAPDVRLSSHPALHGLPLLGRNWSSCAADPGRRDVVRAPAVSSDRDRCGVEHGGSVLLWPVSWPAGQVSPVELLPCHPAVSFPQPCRDSSPCEHVQVPEGRFGHAMPEVGAPSSDYGVELFQQLFQ